MPRSMSQMYGEVPTEIQIAVKHSMRVRDYYTIMSNVCSYHFLRSSSERWREHRGVRTDKT